jgi:O-acetyl-ADP-ribose deacetylase (regulator of RNase III)
MSAQERIDVVVGDITTLEVDAVVNAANRSLKPGGGVDGAINRAAGPKLAAAMAEHGQCPTGSAVLTPGFDLPAGHVIHAVGPRWQGGGKGERDLLVGAYRSALEIAAERDFDAIAFPAISAGVYGYPPEQAAQVSVETVAAFLADHDRPAKVVLCAFDDTQAGLWRAALADVG